VQTSEERFAAYVDSLIGVIARRPGQAAAGHCTGLLMPCEEHGTDGGGDGAGAGTDGGPASIPSAFCR
jgi:hypothetical protein